MKFKWLWIATVALLAGISFAEDIKPGLWEATIQGDSISAIQQGLAKMPPDKRKQEEARMVEHGYEMNDSGMIVKMCITPEIAKMILQQPDDCTTTTVDNTRKIVCTKPGMVMEQEFRETLI